MGIASDLRASVLQAAIQGKLTEQLSTDGNARDLLAKIKAEKEQLIKDKKIKKEKALAPISDDEKPFDVPENWEWCYLQNIVNIRSAVRVHQSDWKTTGVPFYRAREIVTLAKQGFVDNELFIDEQKYEEYKQTTGVPCEGDIMVSGVGTLGAAYIVKATDRFYYKDASVLCFENRFGIFPQYLLLLLNSPLLKKQIYSNEAFGTTVATLTMDRAYSFRIPLPPLAEQERIVERVDALMKEIDELEKIETELEHIKKEFPNDMKAALLQSAMQGKLTQQLASDGRASEIFHNIGVEPIRDTSDMPFDIPDNWEWYNFGDIADTRCGKTPPRAESEWWKEDINWVSIADMPESGVLTKTKECISDKALTEKFNNNISKAGTLIMSFKLTVGRVSILGIDAVHNEAIISIYPKINEGNIMRDYFFKVLPYITSWGDSKNAIKGKTLNSKSIYALPIPVPPLAEQERIVAQLDRLLPLCESLKEK